MSQLDGVIAFLDNRSFGSIWYWFALVGMWSAAGRNVLGIPVEVLARARQAQKAGEGEGPAVVTLLDWLSLTLPRWQPGAREGAVFVGICAFLLSSLAVMGFGYGLEMAQALTLLLTPFLVLFLMRLALARGLMPVMLAGQSGDMPLAEAGDLVARRLTRHRRMVTALSMAAVAITALWGTLHSLMHPNGL